MLDGPARGGSWDRKRITELLIEAGERAAALRDELDCALKEDCSLVTRADREIEDLMAREYDRPGLGSRLIGEETVAQKGEDYLQAAMEGVAYVVDPIDGTSPYAHHLPNWGISVGRMEAGVMTDGAVYLPDYRLMALSDGPLVYQGTRPESSKAWSFRELSPPPVERGPTGLIAITQEIAKSGRVRAPNPVQALGAAVVPLLGLAVGRFLAYAGSVRLWDIAGSLPILSRLKFSITRLRPRAEMGLRVGPESYFLDPGHPFRWGVRGGMLVCPPSEEAWLREALVY